MLESAEKISKYYHTLRYLKPRQTIGRSFAGLKRRLMLYQSTGIPEKLTGSLKHRTNFLRHDPWNSRNSILEGEFTFLNRTRKYEQAIDWNSADMPMLWRFNLHYFGYLHLLEDGEKESICLDWIRKNPEGKTIGWHPYPLSLRITNWSKEALSRPEVLVSLYSQAAFLYRNLETYHPGNHLLENARALIFAGLFFFGEGEAMRWLRRGVQIIEKELPVQVLPDGGYFERTTMYHALMLENFLDILNVMEEAYIRIPGMKEKACKMGDFLYSLTHPGGEISLFNDSTLEIAPPSGKILRYLKELTGYTPVYRAEFPETGYFVHRGSNLCLIIDGGILGPDYLPAHSHADIFSYELSLFNEKIITDSGVYEYQEGPMRNYVRSTRAHNTVAVDHLDQAECWGSFRLAKRFPPKDVRFFRESCRSTFQGRFEGYRSLIGHGITHHRRIDADEDKGVVSVQDTIKGEGRHLAESFIHLNPSLSLTSEGNKFIIKTGGKTIKIIPESGMPSVEDGWYCDQFGRKLESRVIVLSQDTLPAFISYRIEF